MTTEFKRSVYCGEVSKKLLGKEIDLCGWVRTRRDHGGLIFIDLADQTGIMQLVFNPDFNQDTHKTAHALRSEFVISVHGTVVNRSAETINKNLPTGALELQIDTLSILNKSKALPFQLEEAENVDEEIRLKYRYLDLRRDTMKKNIKLRHDVSFAVRNYLAQEGFYEIETPILSKSTPEGARDFVVPSRLQHGKFYALPQAPQMYKQLLMVGGIDKYFQVARCFRDEDLRADRQPEFTQLDLEMAFVDEKKLQDICEGILAEAWKAAFGKAPKTPFPRLTYAEAFERFGSDSPDMRFELEIKNVTELFKNTELSFLRAILEKGGQAGAIHVSDKTFSRSELDGLVSTSIKKLGAKGLLYVRFNEDGSPDSPVSKFLPQDFLKQAQSVFPSLTAKDTLFIVSDVYEDAWTVLGKLRLELGNRLGLIDKDDFKFVWVTDFPMFEWSKENKRWNAVHHPFTQPSHALDKKQSDEDLKKLTARAYDIVCNGCELGGGSMRIHDSEMQKKVFEILGISEKDAQEKFGFLLNAQNLGYPPHGGFALGLDRLIMILARVGSIREVIAFPKTQSGSCPLMDTPASVDAKQLKELGIKNI